MSRREPLYPHVPKSRELLYPRPSKAIAELPIFAGKAYRVDIENWGIPRDATVATMVRFEQEELGNVYDISPELMTELGKYHYSDATWVTKTREDARNYLSEGMSDKDISEITSLSGGTIITENGMGGYLVLQPNARPRQSTSPFVLEQTQKAEFWDLTKTHMPFYDAMIKDPDYFRKAKGYESKIVYMTPESYMMGAAKIHGSTLAAEYRHLGRAFVSTYKDRMLTGEKFPIPVLDYAVGLQEGRNRAIAAKETGATIIPVLVVTWSKPSSQQTTSPSTHPLESSSIKKERIAKYSAGSVQVYFVDGSYVRDNIDLNFTQGGHHYAYDWIPDTEIWLDSSNREEYQFILLHELRERNRMIGGLSYYFAHDDANTIEQQARNKPGTVHSLILHELAHPELKRR